MGVHLSHSLLTRVCLHYHQHLIHCTDCIPIVAEFLGDIAIPLALILLGASFARLHVPRPLSRLPIMAMIAVALAKMLLLPVIGVFTVQGMVKGGLIDKDAKAEKFVAMFLSGTPAAVK